MTTRHTATALGLGLAAVAAIAAGVTIRRGPRTPPEASAPAAASAPAGRPPLAPGDTRVLEPQRVGPSPGPFAFDPMVADRLVTCEAESRDGGKTWHPFAAEAGRGPMLLGGGRRLPPVAGESPRALCADLILSGGGLGAIDGVAEWSGDGWRSGGLRLAADAAPQLAVAVAYDDRGGMAVVHGDRYRSEHGQSELPGPASAFALSESGTAYGAFTTAEGKGTLMWASSPGGTWTRVQAPGAVVRLAAAGDRAFAAAQMLGRGREGQWDWTPWPRDLRPQGLSVSDQVVLAWGSPGGDRASGLAVSRDGGATLEYLSAPLGTGLTFAALDPHQPAQVLAIDDQGSLVRLAID